MSNYKILPTGQLEAFFTFAIEKRFRKQGHPLTEIDNDTIMVIVHSKPHYNQLGKENATALICRNVKVNINPTPEKPSYGVTGKKYYWDYEYNFGSVSTMLMSELFKLTGRDPYLGAWSGHPFDLAKQKINNPK